MNPISYDNFKPFVSSNTGAVSVCDSNKVGYKASNNAEDKFEKSSSGEKNKKLSKSTILKIGAAATSAVALGLFLINKKRFNSSKVLPENIQFKPAESLADAIEFGKKTLGIKKYKGFSENDLDVVNWINEGFVNTSNSLKGKVTMPKNVNYDNELLSANTLAGVIRSGEHKGWFGVNKEIFSNIDASIEKELKKAVDNIGVFKKTEDGKYIAANLLYEKGTFKKVVAAIDDYNNNKLSFNKKVQLFENLRGYNELPSTLYNSPFVQIKKMLNTPDAKKIYTDEQIKQALEDIKKLPMEEQKNEFKALRRKLNQKYEKNESSPFRTIYHEMGHIQDTKPRMSTIDKFDFKPENYPEDLKKWVENTNNIQIVTSVSPYSAYGEGEFIAETFAELIEGRKISDDAMELYKKLGGPMLP